MVLKSENFKDSAKSFEEFKEILQKYEINSFSKFNVDYSEKGFLNEKCKYSEIIFLIRIL